MSEEIYRKKSLDRVKSPDALDDYIRVSAPGVWLLLVSVIVLLAGVCVWGIFGRIERTVDARIRVEQGTAVLSVAIEDIPSVRAGMTVRTDSFEAVVSSEGPEEGSEYYCVLPAGQQIPDGSYTGKIITESISPVSFVIN